VARSKNLHADAVAGVDMENRNCNFCRWPESNRCRTLSAIFASHELSNAVSGSPPTLTLVDAPGEAVAAAIGNDEET
jgi:hypothetical protein